MVSLCQKQDVLSSLATLRHSKAWCGVRDNQCQKSKPGDKTICTNSLPDQ